MIRILTDSACDILPAEAQQLLQAFFVSLREKRAGRPRWKPPVPENRGK